MVAFRFRVWLGALTLSLTVAAGPLLAAITPVGDVSPSTIGQLPSTSVIVGNTDVGGLFIDTGSALTTQTGTVGMSEFAIGTAKITGAGSEWTNSGTLYVGRYGMGVVDVEAEGRLTSAATYVGDEEYGMGTITVSEAGSEWIHTSLFLGNYGSGFLEVGAGGSATGSIVYLGYKAGSIGAASVTGFGSNWTIYNRLFVGYEGDGTLSVSNGGELVVRELYASLNDLEGNGTISVSESAVFDGVLHYDVSDDSQAVITFGSGGILNLQSLSTFGIGYKQNGSLTVSNGVKFSSVEALLGYRDGSTGTVTVSGTGSEWSATSLHVGAAGSGILTIEAGGRVDNGRSYIGRYLGSAGAVTVTGAGSMWTNSDAITIGTVGSLTIAAGGQVINTSGTVGLDSNFPPRISSDLQSESVAAMSHASESRVMVTGLGSKWTNNGLLTVGHSDTASLTVEAGGEISSFAAYLGRYSGSAGTALVTGAGSTWTNTDSFSVGHSGNGTMSITSAGLLAVGGTLTTDRYSPIGDSFINLATGGMLALAGDADDSLAQFLDLVQGTDALRYWDASLADWSRLTNATYGDDYTLEYLTTGDLAGYTLLTVGRVGDFDNDGDVDGRDFLAWQRHPELGSVADWQNVYGSEAPMAINVPEPTGWLLLALGIGVLGSRAKVARINR